MFLTDFDPDFKAVIEPGSTLPFVNDFPKTIVSVFSHTLFQAILDFLGGKKIAESNDVDGDWPIYETYYKGKRFAFYKGRLGAPACVSCFEEVISMGAERIILLGNCGVLDKRIQDCGIIIPTSAIRGEGTSMYYLPPADLICVNRNHQALFQEILSEHGYPWITGTTWTTDAFFRETRGKIDAAKAFGAICVEMECAAMQAMCDFRNVDFFQFFYAGDNLDHSAWDIRSLGGNIKLDEKEKIALLAFELAFRIETE